MYVKLFTQILDSSIAENRRLRHFFTDLMLCSDPTGEVMMTKQAIARKIGATIEEVEWGIEELMKPDELSKTPDHDGRRIEPVEGHAYGWKILNFESYKKLKDNDQLREATRERVRKFRERKKIEIVGDNVTPCNVTVTPVTPRRGRGNKKEEEEDIEPNGSLHQEFIRKWEEVYQSTLGHKYVFNGGRDGKAVKALIATGDSIDLIIESARLTWTGKDEFLKKRAATIHGFQSALNEIRMAIKLVKPSTVIRPSYDELKARGAV
jgi:hypothetical protein